MTQATLASARMPRGFYRLIAAQFFSALADNALLIVAMALLAEQGMPIWWAPMLKFCFTLAYVIFAPGVGPLADALPKARLMAWMNLLKIVGVLGLALQTHPLLAFAIVGLGAAAYAPAKYGLITELVPPRQLVAANSWLEVTVVCAALMGTVLGGLLVAAPVVAIGAEWGGPWQGRGAWFAHHTVYGASLLALLGIYFVASALNLGIPDSGARYASSTPRLHVLVREFTDANSLLWRDAWGGLSLAVTTIFWGFGATLQFAVLRWAQDSLQLSLEQAAYLQAAVAIGVVGGAVLAGKWVGLHQAMRVLPLGVLLGLLVPVVALVDELGPALVLLVVLGVAGGAMVVPMNALLQHRGYQLLTAGRSIAVQGFNENLGVLAMLAVYAGLLGLDWPIEAIMTCFGLGIAAGVLLLALRARRLAPLVH
ncbi:lysophospholipid transporter LplT [Variovorax sp. VNK109]|uniref:lysophospholipid transporter LplT n=1 Tax=Variovorax sp. VNK109 TaxID=3400919 RepID=UPI003C06B943